jgi:hypothetical protein
MAFGAAVQNKDYVKICDDMLAQALVQKMEQVGLSCVVALRQGLGSVEAPTLEVREVDVRGDRALVSVHSVARGQAASDDALTLVRQDGRWRIASLAAPGDRGGLGSVRGTTATTPAPPPTG